MSSSQSNLLFARGPAGRPGVRSCLLLTALWPQASFLASLSPSALMLGMGTRVGTEPTPEVRVQGDPSSQEDAGTVENVALGAIITARVLRPGPALLVTPEPQVGLMRVRLRPEMCLQVTPGRHPGSTQPRPDMEHELRAGQGRHQVSRGQDPVMGPNPRRAPRLQALGRGPVWKRRCWGLRGRWSQPTKLHSRLQRSCLEGRKLSPNLSPETCHCQSSGAVAREDCDTPALGRCQQAKAAEAQLRASSWVPSTAPGPRALMPHPRPRSPTTTEGQDTARWPQDCRVQKVTPAKARIWGVG